MGKYMRKCRGAAGNKAPAVELRAQVVLGVCTRSRSATATLAAVARATAPKRRKTTTTARVQEEGLGRDDGAVGCCYLHLRSRRLFMAAAAVVAPRGPGAEEASTPAAPADSGASGKAVVTGISRCSSMASSVDVVARERSGGAAEACEDRDVESSVSDSGSGREWRETTPSSRPPGNLSDLESSQGADEQKHHRRRCPATTTTSATFHAAAATRARMPPAAEIEEFFAAAERDEAERFAAKYNFDVVRGVPINAGRFEWTPVASG